MGNNLEEGKSLVQLAMIIMILSGFMFTLAGVSYSNSVQTSKEILSILNERTINLVKMDVSNLSKTEQEMINKTLVTTEDYSRLPLSQIGLSKFSLIFGIVLALTSFIIWVFGHSKIKNSG